MFNPKRCLQPLDNSDLAMASAKSLSKKVIYTGSPALKRDPGDFKLTPPAAARQNATLCDDAKVYTWLEATSLLKQGAAKGLVDARSVDGFPCLIWSVREEDGTVFEAQLENANLGQYHGYPMPLSDPFRQVVIDRTRRR